MQNSKYALKSRYYLRCTWVPENFPGTTWAITIQVVYFTWASAQVLPEYTCAQLWWELDELSRNKSAKSWLA